MEEQIDMDDIREVQAQAMEDEGLLAFEKHIGRIEWLHSADDIFNIKSDKKYVVIDVARQKLAYESDKLEDIAREFGTSTSYVGQRYKAKKLLHKQYMIVRCKHGQRDITKSNRYIWNRKSKGYDN